MAKTIMIKNGNILVPYHIYSCSRCGKQIEEAYPMEIIDGKCYCGDCAFIDGKITEKELLKNYYFFLGDRCGASIYDGEVYVTTSKKFPWERTSRDRDCKEYKEWRKSVFERDDYTCQKCGKIGGVLNAHHIKSYKNYPKLRYVLKNGITLCEDCHRDVHRKRVV